MRKHLVAVATVQRQGQLRGEQSVASAEIITPPRVFQRQVLFLPGEFGESSGKRDGSMWLTRKHASQQLHHGGSENMNAKETEIVARADSRHHQALFGFRGCGFFEYRLHAINAGPAGHAASRHGAKPGEQTFAGGLDPGGGARLDFRQLHQALDAGLRCAHVQMISHHVQEGLIGHKFARTINGVAVSPRLLLGNESHRAGEIAGSLRVAGLVAGPDHDADLANIRGEGLFDQDVQNGFFRSVLDESLERKRPLIPSRCCDDRLSDPHG